MAKMRKRSELPTKMCPTCGRPFTWRKRWARNWDEIVYCSDRCRRRRHERDRDEPSGHATVAGG